MPQEFIPALGFGTFGRTGSAGVAAILCALQAGYRHLDTAQSYNTEREVGEAVRRSGLKRSEVFITTKITAANCQRGKLIPSLERSRDEIGVDGLDLTLIHWPVDPTHEMDKRAYLPELADAQQRGLTRLIGVSNFTIADIEETKAILGPRAIANNQIECHPFLQNRPLVNHCLANDISVTCYLPIARGKLAGEPTMERIAARHGATVEQIALAFELARGLFAIPTSGREERIRSNYRGLEVKLSDDDVAAIEAVDRGTRYIDPPWSPNWD